MDRIIDSRRVREGYVTVTVVTLADDEGTEYLREVVSFGDSACVLPYDPVRKVAMVVRLPRAPAIFKGVETLFIEVPAGMIDPGETAEVAAIREAMEETGIALAGVERVATVFPSPGVIAERSHMFLAAYGAADRTGAGGGLAHEHEGISVEEIPLGELWAAVVGSTIADMKTLALVLALHARRPELF